VTPAFIEVGSGLQPDPNDETNALLRVLIYKMDGTTFGGNVPALPQWPGPPHMIVPVQAMLYANLAASIFSAPPPPAMLGKQWLNRYASVYMRGSAIERNQNRQRKLNGIVTWCLGHVMEALPLMLQFALLLLGCALSLYLWGINTTVVSVILSVAVFGLIFYIFIVAAGAAFVSRPYQTPGAQILRYVWQQVSSHSTFFAVKGPTVHQPETHPGPEQALDREGTAWTSAASRGCCKRRWTGASTG